MGNMYEITETEKKQLKSKVEGIDYIDILNQDDNEITKEIQACLEKYNEQICIVLNLERKLTSVLKEYLEDLDYEGARIIVFSDFTKEFLNRDFNKLNEKNFQVYNKVHNKLSYEVSKRVFDFCFAFCVLLMISPIMIVIAILIKIKSPEGPIFFTQNRLGKNKEYFRVFKFRTMVPNAEKVLEDMLEKNDEIREQYLKYRKLDDDPRIIPVIGHFLRKSSLDELPQFFNVLFGDMSIVGPRPYIAGEFYNHDKKFKKIILSMKPGITGYWQIGDRHNDTFDKRVKKDLQYLLRRSFLLDLKIVLKTFGVMLLRKGA